MKRATMRKLNRQIERVAIMQWFVYGFATAAAICTALGLWIAKLTMMI